MSERIIAPAGTDLVRLDAVSVDFVTGAGVTSAVRDVSLRVTEGEVFGLVGESGCGKTTLAMALMGLLPGNARVTGRLCFRGDDLAGMTEDEKRRLRGDRLSMIFQDPATSLDPTFSVGSQVAEAIRAHRKVSRADARRRATELLTEVGIPAAAQRYADPPHRFSGGMRQRVVIAAALSNEPALLVADEPTTALDVTIQAQILDLLRSLRDRHRTAILLIAHDLGVVAQICDRVGVMYAGQLVEVAPVNELFERPRHPYTQALLGAIPSAAHAAGELRVIAGQVPDLSQPPPGCRFADRCPYRRDECATPPPLAAVLAGGQRRHAAPTVVDVAGYGQQIACWLDPATRQAGGLTPLDQEGVPVHD